MPSVWQLYDSWELMRCKILLMSTNLVVDLVCGIFPSALCRCLPQSSSQMELPTCSQWTLQHTKKLMHIDRGSVLHITESTTATALIDFFFLAYGITQYFLQVLKHQQQTTECNDHYEVETFQYYINIVNISRANRMFLFRASSAAIANLYSTVVSEASNWRQLKWQLEL